MNLTQTLSQAFLYFVPFLFALCFHEYAHGWVARLKGDRTAEIMGRLTLNPAAHADLYGTIILPMLALLFKFPFFGWAKPVPVNERNLKDPVRDMFWIALAGPLSNILLAFLATLGYVLVYHFNLDGGRGDGVVEILKIFIMVNLFLAVFNLIPLHPLDGGKVIARFLPDNVNRLLEDNQSVTSMMLIALMVTGLLSYLAIPVYALAEGLFTVAHSLASLIP